MTCGKEVSTIDKPGHHCGTTAPISWYVVLVLLLIYTAGCGDPGKPMSGYEKARPNVLVLTVDTLRADLLGSYQGPAFTPNIDSLAEQGLLFENAVAPVPSTRASHFSIFSGLHPRQHGVLSNADSLPEGVDTFPSVLQQAGYSTSGFTGVKLLAPGSGAERGFDDFDAPETGHRVAGEVIDLALSWLQPQVGSSN